MTFVPMLAGDKSAALFVPNSSAGTQATIPLNGTGTISGTFDLFNARTGKVLEVVGGSTSNGALVQQNTLNGSPQQQWQLTPLGNGAYSIANVLSGDVLDVIMGSRADGTLIQQYQYLGDSNQQWN